MISHAHLPEWDENDGWKLTLPPPKRGDACVLPTIVRGNQIVWSAYWLTNGIGGSGHYYSDLTHPLESVGRYVVERRQPPTRSPDTDR